MSTITIAGREYQAQGGLLEDIQINHLLWLRKNAGIGMKTIITVMDGITKKASYALEEVRSAEGLTRDEMGEKVGRVMFDAFDDDETLHVLQAVIWIVRARAGDRGPDGLYLTIDAANEGVTVTDFVTLAFGVDDEPDPTVLDEESADLS